MLRISTESEDDDGGGGASYPSLPPPQHAAKSGLAAATRGFRVIVGPRGHQAGAVEFRVWCLVPLDMFRGIGFQSSP